MWRRNVLVAWCGLAGLGLSAPAAGLAAPDEAFKTAMTALLDQGWQASPKDQTQDELAGYYARAAQARPGDARAPYAYALVQFRQHKYEAALKFLDEALALDKANGAARRAKIWLLVLTKKKSAALVEIDTLSKFFPQQDAPPAAGNDEFVQTAAFLGRIYAYLEGPGLTTANNTSLLEHKTKLWERMPLPERSAFEKSFNRVASRFGELTHTKDQTQADEKAEQERQRATARADLLAEKSEAEKDLDGLDAKAEKMRADLAQQTSDLDAQIAPLNTQLSQLASKAAALEGELAVLQNNVAGLLNQAAFSKDPGEGSALRAEALRQDVLAARDDADLRAVQLQAADLTARRLLLVSRRQTAQNRAQSALDNLDNQEAPLRATLKRVAIEEQKLNKPIRASTTRVTAMSNVLEALSTYAALPVEEEKQRLLDSLEFAMP
ncbi:MAG TPA: hypothetical protein VFE24_13280 [Pirellulales bacterium]|jgi:DNA repair exonuclease SbcCD ATPase subunit|nr:hypothetical protein [Pirellulales bacterium]